MKASLLMAAALAGLLTVSGCAAGSSESGAKPAETATTPAALASAGAASVPSTAGPSPAAADAAAPSSSQGTTSTEDKVHFTGDYSQTTQADSDRILELNKQWITPEKQAALKAKLDSAGLSSNIPGEIAESWYSGRAGTFCQARFDGHDMAAEGVWVEIEKVVRSVYCPELG